MIVQVPAINGLGKTKGCEIAPEFICNSLKLESEVISINNEDLDDAELEIYNRACEILNLAKTKNEKVIFIGGDHSISYSIGKAFLEKNRNPAMLIFDAHPDLMKPMQNPTHEEWLRALIESKNFTDVLLVGIRKNSVNVDKREISYAKKKSIKIIYADEFEIKKEEIINFCKNKEVYISIDIDVFDSSLVDSTAYPEANGLNRNLIKVIKNIKNINILDLVEINPLKGNIKKTIKIVEEILK